MNEQGRKAKGCVMLQVCQELERQTERAKLVAAHDGVDLEYLKNIMLKLYETGKPTALHTLPRTPLASCSRACLVYLSKYTC